MSNQKIMRFLKRTGMTPLYKSTLSPLISKLFHMQLVGETKNFSTCKWLGQPVWQNTFDLWTIQEAIWEIQPELLIECGTNAGGSAYFYARLFDLIGKGRIVTIDIEKMHDISHPRIDFLIGSSISEDIINQVREKVAQTRGPIMVILDSDHSASHVWQEMELYAPFVSPNSFMLVQDGCIDTLPIFKNGRPGPLVAIRKFIANHREFEIDKEQGRRFLISSHPDGWLRRKPVELAHHTQD